MYFTAQANIGYSTRILAGEASYFQYLIVAAKIIRNDQLSCIPEIAFKHIPGDFIGAYKIIIPLN